MVVLTHRFLLRYSCVGYSIFHCLEWVRPAHTQIVAVYLKQDAQGLSLMIKDTGSPRHGSASPMTNACQRLSLSSHSLSIHFIMYRIGDSAKNAFHSNPTNTVFDVKRLIGRKFNEPDVQRDLRYWPFTVRDIAGKPSIQIRHHGELKDFVKSTLYLLLVDSLGPFDRLPKRSVPWFLRR